MVDGAIDGTPSVLVDAVIFPDGEQSLKMLEKNGAAKYCLRQAYKHLKPLGLVGEAKRMLKAAGLSEDSQDAGLVLESDAQKLMKPFIEAMKQHRIWAREDKAKDVAA